jgi:cation:H+ antiporter
VSQLPLGLAAVVFAVAAVAVWVAGVRLSNATDLLSGRLRLGEALGGVVLLAIVTNLPEIAITSTAALDHKLDLAVGNILGGIAIQTVVLVALDAFGVRDRPLTNAAVDLVLVLEAAVLIAILVIAIMGTRLAPSITFARLDPADALIVVVWIAGVWLVSKARTGIPWRAESAERQPAQQDDTSASTARAVVVFAVASLVTLGAGVALTQTGERIADALHMTGVIFGSTVLAAVTALPELSTGLSAMKLRAYDLAISDIFGGNAFLPVLFLVATLLSGQPVLPSAHASDIYLAGLGILLTCIYLGGLIFRYRRQVVRLGYDSLAVLAVYVLGVLGLFAVRG